jgi:MFS family permease
MNTKFWSKDFLILLWIGFGVSLVLNMQNVILPIYLIDLGGSVESLGLLTGLFTFSAMLMRPIYGYLSDRIGKRIVLLIGLSLFTLVIFIFGFEISVLGLLVLRVFQGIGFSGQNTATGAMVPDIVDTKDLTKAFGYAFIAGTLASAFGPVSALYLKTLMGYHNFFMVVFAISAITWVASLALSKQKVVFSNEAFNLKNFIEASALKASFIIFLSGIGLSSVFTFLVPYAIELGIVNIGLFFTVYSIANFVGIKAPETLSIFTTQRTLIIGLISNMIAYLILAVSSQLFHFLIAAIFVGFGFGALMPSLQNLAVKDAHADRRGAATATFFSSMDLSFTVGAISIGLLSSMIGMKNIYVLSALLSLVTLAFYAQLIHPQLKKDA